jgi:hypothetical protein
MEFVVAGIARLGRRSFSTRRWRIDWRRDECGPDAEAVVAVWNLVCMMRGDGEKMRREGLTLSQTYGFWMLATRPELGSLERHPGAIRVLLALWFYFQ